MNKYKKMLTDEILIYQPLMCPTAFKLHKPVFTFHVIFGTGEATIWWKLLTF